MDVFKTYIIINNEDSQGPDKFLVVNVFHLANFLVRNPLPFGDKDRYYIYVIIRDQTLNSWLSIEDFICETEKSIQSARP